MGARQSPRVLGYTTRRYRRQGALQCISLRPCGHAARLCLHECATIGEGNGSRMQDGRAPPILEHVGRGMWILPTRPHLCPQASHWCLLCHGARQLTRGTPLSHPHALARVLRASPRARPSPVPPGHSTHVPQPSSATAYGSAPPTVSPACSARSIQDCDGQRWCIMLRAVVQERSAGTRPCNVLNAL